MEGDLGAAYAARKGETVVFWGYTSATTSMAALEQFSDHADTAELLRWLRTFKKPPRTTFLVHGEPEAASLLQQAMR